jgi:hypothetical protein
LDTFSYPGKPDGCILLIPMTIRVDKLDT